MTRDVDPELNAEIRAALEQIAHAKRSLAADDMEVLGQAMTFIDQWSAKLLVWAAEGRIQEDPALVALLDEAQSLILELSNEHRRLSERLKEARHQRRAGSAYRQAQRL